MSSSSASKGRILVVDDDRLVLATVTHGLSQAGYEVIDADNGDDAILLAREHRPALALLDIRMEGKSGFDVAETLRDAYRIPFMFLSAFADEGTLAKVKELGALAYLIKPLDVGQIVPSVDAAFERLARASTSGDGSSSGSSSESGGESSSQFGGPRGNAPAGTPDGLPSDRPSDRPDNWPANRPNDAPGIKAPAPTPTAEQPTAAQPPAAPSPAAMLADPVPLAVGVLMHRYSLPRDAALARLQRLAADGKQTTAAQAERLLAAVEELARSAL